MSSNTYSVKRVSLECIIVGKKRKFVECFVDPRDVELTIRVFTSVKVIFVVKFSVTTALPLPQKNIAPFL